MKKLGGSDDQPTTLEGDFYSVERPWKARKTGQILFISIHPVKERDNRTESAEIDPWTLPYPSSLNQPALPSVYHHYYHKHTPSSHPVFVQCTVLYVSYITGNTGCDVSLILITPPPSPIPAYCLQKKSFYYHYNNHRQPSRIILERLILYK